LVLSNLFLQLYEVPNKNIALKSCCKELIVRKSNT
jgi:hypothetical protein